MAKRDVLEGVVLRDLYYILVSTFLFSLEIY